MFKSLRMKLLLFFIGTTFLPLLFISYISFQSQKQDIENQHKQLLYTLGESAAVNLDDFIQERFSDVYALSENPLIMERDANIEEIAAELNKFVQIHSLYYGAIFLNEEGVVVADTDQTMVGTDLSSREWVQNTLNGGIFLSDIYQSDAIHGPILILSASVEDELGNVIGAVSPSFNLIELWERIELFTRQQQSIGLGGFAFLMNGDGHLIAHPEIDRINDYNYFQANNLSLEQLNHMVRNNLYFENEEREHHQYFVQLDKTNGFEHDWYIGISVPKSHVAEPLQQLIGKYIFLFSCVFVIVIFAIVKLSNYIVKPLQKLVYATSDFAFGKIVDPLSTNAYHEVNTLTRAFNMMTRRLVEREKSQQKSSLILEATNNGIFAFQRDSRLITTFNQTCEEIFGVKKEAVIGLRIDDLIKYNETFAQFLHCAKLQDALEKRKFNDRFEFYCQHKEEARYFFMSVQPLPSMNNQDDYEGILVVFDDITDKREMEIELNRSEKLQMVGQLSAGFAHEIRNPLTTIRGFMQVFKKSGVNVEQQEHYDLILQEIDRVNDIISEMLNIANPNVIRSKEETNINDVIKGIFSLYKTEAGWRRTQVILELEDVPTLFIEKNKLHQIIMNLVKNGLEAINVEGELKIQTYKCTDGEQVLIKIIDNGEGMDERTLDKLGTPFFTTKESGTGLGIITCFRLVEELGGTLSVKSEKDKGTIFTIELPNKRSS